MSKDRYDLEKKKQFIENALKDYKNNLDIGDICNVEEVEKTDGTFTQIGIRPLVDEDMLLPDKKGVHFHPELPTIGMTVANGERDFLIKNILDNKKIERIKINKDKINEFPKYAYEFDESTILISTKFFVGLHKIFFNRIKYTDSGTILDSNYKLDFVPEKVLGNKIIIIDKNAILWQKQKFKNDIVNQEGTLDIQIKPHESGKTDILVRSVNKMVYIDTDLIKIIEVEEDDEEK